MPPTSPTPLPADRSMWPGRMTSSMPSASIAVIDSSIDSSERLRADRKTGCANAKKAQIRTSAITIEKLRSEMRSVMEARSDSMTARLSHYTWGASAASAGGVTRACPWRRRAAAPASLRRGWNGAADFALVQHDDAVAHADQLGQLARDEDDRLAFAGERLMSS